MNFVSSPELKDDAEHHKDKETASKMKRMVKKESQASLALPIGIGPWLR